MRKRIRKSESEDQGLLLSPEELEQYQDTSGEEAEEQEEEPRVEEHNLPELERLVTSFVTELHELVEHEAQKRVRTLLRSAMGYKRVGRPRKHDSH